MNARPNDYIIQRRYVRLYQWVLFLLLGIILGGLYVTQAASQPVVEEDPRLVLMCQMPKQNGEAMFVTMRDGKYECWDNLQ